MTVTHISRALSVENPHIVRAVGYAVGTRPSGLNPALQFRSAAPQEHDSHSEGYLVCSGHADESNERCREMPSTPYNIIAIGAVGQDLLRKEKDVRASASYGASSLFLLVARASLVLLWCTLLEGLVFRDPTPSEPLSHASPAMPEATKTRSHCITIAQEAIGCVVLQQGALRILLHPLPLD